MVPRVYEQILELPGAAQAQSFLQKGCPGDRLTLARLFHRLKLNFLCEREDTGCRGQKLGQCPLLLEAGLGYFQRF